MAKATKRVTATTWKITNLEKSGSNGKVTAAHYVVIADNGISSAESYGSVKFEGKVTTTFSELSEEQVIGWVKEVLGDQKVGHLELAVESRVAEDTTPVKTIALPW